MRRATRALLLAFPLALGAQKPTPRLYLAPDLRIDAPEQRVNGGRLIRIGADGRMIVSPKNYFGEIRAYDSLGKSLGWAIPTASPDGDIGWMGRAGWMGSTLWIDDPRFHQVVFVSPAGKVTKTIANPSWVHPHWSDRRKYPLFANMEAVAVYPDTSMLVVPVGPRSLIDTPDFDKSVEHLLRINSEGAIERTVATFDRDMNRVTIRSPENHNEHSFPVPFGGYSNWKVSSDGKRIVFVTPGAAADSGRFRVTALGENGDTIFNRRYDAPAVRVNQKAVDSILAAIRPFGSTPAEEIRARVAKKVPPFQSFVTDAFVGLDHSTWIIMRPVSDTAKARTALLLDERGEPLGTLLMPDNVVPQAVDRSHLWGVEKGKLAVVRFRVQSTPAPTAAPASRSATASRDHTAATH